MTQDQMVKAFNEWMRRYIEEPERFEREFQSVDRFLKDEAEGQEPTYGDSCARYIEELVAEQTA